MGNLNIFFTVSSPAPTNGYLIKYRRVGTVPYTTVSPNQTVSPAVITGVNSTFSYEGTVQSDCSNGVYSPPSVFTVDPCVGPNFKVIGQQCVQATRVNIQSVNNGNSTFTCHYRYEFPDGTFSITYFETNALPCAL